ncbi:hypothetical protein A3SI_13919 [Nitritalea halalkaliphila LW7]|uniref:Uncharacterized protein n=1 Tax=Nitritalea halalkaliphila LW7 TaxID=1189621 RepID=I5C080_9BACT|nr:hypothetical protein [Nitritalea halalkaliphila]EIM75232.1 hypothetical protein A3SI_13919 [Nitritalea halalkaliphila LW7]
MKLTCDQELYSEFDRQLPELSVELRSEATLQEQQKLIHIIVQFADYTEKRLLQGDKKSLKKVSDAGGKIVQKRE